MIRLLTLDDLTKWVDEAAKFHASVGLPGVFKPDAFLGAWKALLGLGRGFVIGRFSDTGEPHETIGVMVYPDPFTGDMTASAMFWFQTDNQGLATGFIIKALQHECTMRGIKRLFVSIPTARLGDGRSASLGALDFRSVETHYMKEMDI